MPPAARLSPLRERRARCHDDRGDARERRKKRAVEIRDPHRGHRLRERREHDAELQRDAIQIDRRPRDAGRDEQDEEILQRALDDGRRRAAEEICERRIEPRKRVQLEKPRHEQHGEGSADQSGLEVSHARPCIMRRSSRATLAVRE